MTCYTLHTPRGATGIICGRGLGKPCPTCGGLADLLCDRRLHTDRKATCNARTCSHCATHVGPNRDYCRPCMERWLAHGEATGLLSRWPGPQGKKCDEIKNISP